MFDYDGDVSADHAASTRKPAALGVDPVGALEIGERLDARPQTVAQWHFRGLLPPPRWTVSGRPAWNWPDIERWARVTGRWARPAKTNGAGRRRRGRNR
jgi:hypothetical protein